MVKNLCPHPVQRLGAHITNVKDNDNKAVNPEKAYCLACGKVV